MQGVLTLAIELSIFESPGGFQVPTFGSVSFILALNPKWGCDTFGQGQPRHIMFNVSNICPKTSATNINK